jgi:GntR family transcriptional regulator/MocR family aminotransferase
MHAIRQTFGQQLPVIGGDAGLHLVLGLPSHVDDAAVVVQAERAGIASRPLSMYCMRPGKAERGLVLGYGVVSEEDIPKCFAVLAKVIERFL